MSKGSGYFILGLGHPLRRILLISKCSWSHCQLEGIYREVKGTVREYAIYAYDPNVLYGSNHQNEADTE